MVVRQGPILDRFLMRLKDLIIIGTAAMALIKWLYLNPIAMDTRIGAAEKMLTEISSNLKSQNKTIQKIKARLDETERPPGNGYQ